MALGEAPFATAPFAWPAAEEAATTTVDGRPHRGAGELIGSGSLLGLAWSWVVVVDEDGRDQGWTMKQGAARSGSAHSTR